MVRINLSVVFILAASAILPIVALPVNSLPQKPGKRKELHVHVDESHETGFPQASSQAPPAKKQRLEGANE